MLSLRLLPLDVSLRAGPWSGLGLWCLLADLPLRLLDLPDFTAPYASKDLDRCDRSRLPDLPLRLALSSLDGLRTLLLGDPAHPSLGVVRPARLSGDRVARTSGAFPAPWGS